MISLTFTKYLKKKQMKRLRFMQTLLIASVLCLGFSSCGDDDETVTTVDTDFSKLIRGHWANTDVDEDYYYVSLSIDYKGSGTISFYDLINDDDQYGVMAFGTYTLNGNKLTAIYNDVDCKDANYKSFTYHGFSDGKSRTIVYTIQSCDGNKLVLTDESGKNANYEKYADVK